MLTTSFVLIVASSAAWAQGDDDRDGVHDELEGSTERSVVWVTLPEPEPEALSISSRSVAAPEDDQFYLTYESGWFEVRYVRAVDEGRVTSSYNLGLSRIIEWVDQDADGAFDPSEAVYEDAALQTAHVDAETTANPDGGQVSTFTIFVSSPLRSQVFLTLTIAQRFMRVSSDRVLTPMEAKLDVTVHHFFENPGARLVLAYHLRTQVEDRVNLSTDTWDTRHGFSRDETWINITGAATSDSSGVFFSWRNHAAVDTQTGAVMSIVSEGPPEGYQGNPEERDVMIYTAYPAGPDPDRVLVVHDPAMGVVSAAYEDIVSRPTDPQLQADVVVYGISLALVALLVAVSVVAVNRWRRPRP